MKTTALMINPISTGSYRLAASDIRARNRGFRDPHLCVCTVLRYVSYVKYECSQCSVAPEMRLRSLTGTSRSLANFPATT